MNYPKTLTSKLPNMGTSIFAVMSGLAHETGAINLSQGFPDFPISQELIELVHEYMKKGYNQYAPMPGVLALREAIAQKAHDTYNITYNPDTEITITAGATEALFSIITAIIHQGDEVIIIEPAYDSYAPVVELSGGVVRFSSLQVPDYSVNWEEVKSLINHKTKMIIINTPHNPTGSVLKPEDLLTLEKMTEDTDIVVLSDEVYEHLIFDDIRHESVCFYPTLAQRSFVVGSFGKTFHATGWKVGFVMAPKELTAEMRKVHQFVTFAVNTPVQMALSEFIQKPDNYNYVSDFFQQKRDFFAEAVKPSRFRIMPCYGTYFQLLNYKNISNENELDFAKRLTREYGVATVPVSPFYHNRADNHMLRVCFAKGEETLEQAAEILNKI
ncbi:MAG: aminotransferase [Flavobacteriales bacterium]|nr:MAG: aminotransferase [Flavobacteriales bacterium]